MTTEHRSADDADCQKTLLQSYDSKTTTHAALIIALMIGALTLISRWDAFFNKELVLKMIFYGIISLIIGLSVYVVGKTMFWGSLSHTILYVNRKDTDKFEDTNFNFETYTRILADRKYQKSEKKKSEDEDPKDHEIESIMKEFEEKPAIWQFHQVALQILKSRATTTEKPSDDEKLTLEKPFKGWLYYKFLNFVQHFGLWHAIVSILLPLGLLFSLEILGFFGLLIGQICVSVGFLGFFVGLLFSNLRAHKKDIKNLRHQAKVLVNPTPANS